MELTENFKPLRGLVLIRRDIPDDKAGDIIIPESYRQYGWCAEVVAVGDDVDNVKVGDRILFQKEYCVLPFPDRKMGLTDADKILARLEVVEGVERIKPLGSFVLILPDVKSELPGVVITDNYSTSLSGEVVTYGEDCQDVKFSKVWYPNGKGVKCVENDEDYVLIDESEILCCEVEG